jgi:hypothetical protein
VAALWALHLIKGSVFWLWIPELLKWIQAVNAVALSSLHLEPKPTSHAQRQGALVQGHAQKKSHHIPASVGLFRRLVLHSWAPPDVFAVPM